MRGREYSPLRQLSAATSSIGRGILLPDSMKKEYEQTVRTPLAFSVGKSHPSDLLFALFGKKSLCNMTKFARIFCGFCSFDKKSVLKIHKNGKKRFYFQKMGLIRQAELSLPAEWRKKSKKSEIFAKKFQKGYCIICRDSV